MKNILLITAVFGFVIGCSLSYKPEVKDSEIYHQSGNKPDTTLNIRTQK